ncbi:hypothetical protein BOTBODRAFT_124283 [Botryobasidium botryosum FD-172 SS1]|uniref:FMP27 GFWDK domain-containing protein n=1 Tax=Botryobasidium botryosum (strain FD-172 SS1) TaxID=930990 RepID=A0A067N8Z8_BOTB1|nr:hypothetical protein BOTBODRAFT_124283 [Botryobasidium botryosum FD-172 SS1]
MAPELHTSSRGSEIFNTMFILVASLLIFFRYILPYGLQLFNTSIQFSSVSPLSMRGLRIRKADTTVTVERIGYTWNRPVVEGARRFHFKFEDARITVDPSQRAKRSPRQAALVKNQRKSRHFSIYTFSSDNLAPPLALFSLIVPVSLLRRLDQAIRPVFRLFFVSSFRLVISALPWLSQAFDFEIDTIIISSSDKEAGCVVIEGITLAAAVNFTQFKVLSDGLRSDVGTERLRSKQVGKVASWGDRFKGGVGRVWDRAWGKTSASASLTLKFDTAGVYPHVPSALSISRPTSGFMRSRSPSTSNIPTLSTNGSTGNGNAENAAVLLPLPTRFHTSVQFTPKHMALDPHALDITSNIPSVEITLNALQEILAAQKKGSTPALASTSSRPPLKFKMPSATPDSSSLTSPQLIPQHNDAKESNGNKHEVFFNALRAASVTLPAIKVSYTARGSALGDETAMAMSLHGLFAQIGVSDPQANSLHRKWLGAPAKKIKRHPKFDPAVFSFSGGLDSATAHRLGPGSEGEEPHRLLRTGRWSLDAIATNWPPAPLALGSFSAESDAPVVACEVVLDTIEVTERLDLIQKILPPRSPKDPTSPAPSSSRPMGIFPQVAFDMVVNNILVRLLQDEGLGEDADAPVSLDIFTKGFGVHGRTQIHDISSRRASAEKSSDIASMSSNGTYPMRMGVSAYISTEPICTQFRWRPTATSSDASGSHDGGSSMEVLEMPILTLDAVELNMTSHALGFISDTSSIVWLALDTAMGDVRCVTDGLTVEVWHPRSVLALSQLVAKLLPSTPKSSPSVHRPLLSSLPAGVCVHFAIGCVTAIVAGKDINPDCHEAILRGIALQTGIMAQYCFLQPPQHTPRTKQRYVHARLRERLGVPPDIQLEAASFANEAEGTNEHAAIAQTATFNTSCRAIVIECAGDKLPDLDLSPARDARTILNASPLVTRITLRCKRGDHRVDSSGESAQVILNVNRIYGNFELQHVYASLLAVGALRSILPASKSAATEPRPASPTPLQLGLTARVDNLQLNCALPGSQGLFIRGRRLVVESSRRPDRPLQSTARWANILAWVPSAQYPGRWEELLHLQKGTVTVKDGASIVGDGAHLRIPFDFILADLISSIALSGKAIKHLRRITGSGKFVPVPDAGPEDAKIVPTITIKLGVLTAEAADSPMENKLNLIWRAGMLEQQTRLERELAFDAKVAAIREAAAGHQNSESAPSAFEWNFSTKHTISTDEAWMRLQQLNAYSWVKRHQNTKEKMMRREETISHRVRDESSHGEPPLPIEVRPSDKASPLFRAVLSGVALSISESSFGPAGLRTFLHDLGDGLPHDTQFTLLIPLHISWFTKSARISLRDYPLPLFNVPPHPNKTKHAWEFKSDVVLAEEMGPPSSVFWQRCTIVPAESDIPTSKAFSFAVPRTIMPVKSYANPEVFVHSPGITDLSWGVSYMPATQDLMRVVETLSHPPRDSSPSIGFWDKMRLSLHWRARARFAGDVHFHLKGSRDPYQTSGTGAGFVLAWKGSPSISVGYSNSHKELIQVESERMLLAIPNLSHFEDGVTSVGEAIPSDSYNDPFVSPNIERKPVKLCAKLTNGVRMGLGFQFERTCGAECTRCTGADAFHKQCRYFTFKPHYGVQLQYSPESLEGSRDSFAGFRSDFIHFSVSLTSPTLPEQPHGRTQCNSFHLSPQSFAHFWSWWGLFNDALSLPIRQGKLFIGARPPSKKFGRHLATLKYRFSLSPLFITHVYRQESPAGWKNGASTCVGVKTMVESFHADLHQRQQEMTVADAASGKVKKLIHKPFYSAEVAITGLELRIVKAAFAEPRKALAPLDADEDDEGDEDLPDSPCEDMSSKWVDMDDYAETDWQSQDEQPKLWLLPLGRCPKFTYFKRVGANKPFDDEDDEAGVTDVDLETSKFGGEDTHVCFQGEGDSANQVQINITSQRLQILKDQVADLAHRREHTAHYPRDGLSSSRPDSANTNDATAAIQEQNLRKKVELLEDYLNHLRMAGVNGKLGPEVTDSVYYIPSDNISPDDWEKFNNVYHVHCPQICLDDTTRNILLDYYYSSRARRGFEYHMASRSVKFIRELAATYTYNEGPSIGVASSRPATRVSAAAHTLRKMLLRDDRAELPEDKEAGGRCSSTAIFDPSSGWSDDVSIKKSHFCLLLKPQISLQSEHEGGSVLTLGAMSASLQTFTIMDEQHADDAVTGHIMNRNYMKLSGLQAFAPVNSECFDARAQYAVPVEVLIDFRCEHRDFERLVPQTDATMSYDKFNRLRLRDNLTTMSTSPSKEHDQNRDHLRNQTDRIVVDIPRFSVTAKSANFAAIYNTVTNFLLHSDPSHSQQNEKLETFLYSYDFTDFAVAADVVANLQSRIRQMTEVSKGYECRFDDLDEQAKRDFVAIKGQLFTLSEELNLVFGAIQLAQAKLSCSNDEHKSALRLDASSAEISWNMLDQSTDLLAKLSVRGIGFSWLSRNDGSTANKLTIQDFQALDGAPDALFPEMLVKVDGLTHNDKHSRFARATWGVLPPVGGISIVESFELDLHPLRLQLERKVGRKVMQYVFPHRQTDGKASAALAQSRSSKGKMISSLELPKNSSGETSRASMESNDSSTQHGLYLMPSRSASSHSLTEDGEQGGRPPMRRSRSTNALRALIPKATSKDQNGSKSDLLAKKTKEADKEDELDATVMRLRASQNRTFININVSSLIIMLSYKRDTPMSLMTVPDLEDFKFRTPSFQYHNRTLSFEELIEELKRDIYRAAWQQKGALLKEVFTKAKFVTPKRFLHPDQKPRPKLKALVSKSTKETVVEQGGEPSPTDPEGSSRRRWPQVFHHRPPRLSLESAGGSPLIIENTPSASPTSSSGHFLSSDLSMPSTPDSQERPRGRARVLSLFRKAPTPRNGSESSFSTARRHSTETSQVRLVGSDQGRDLQNKSGALHADR